MRSMPKNITKELLEKLYVDEKKSLREIGNLVKKTQVQVSRYLKKFSIEARPFSTKGLSPLLGKVLSDETKDKIRKAHLGKKLSPEHRDKVIMTLNHGMGEENPNWKGGKSITKEGYRLIRTEEGYIKEHRIVMEKHLGRKLTPDENIHHINKDKLDNRIENLLLVSNSEHHNEFHWNEEERKSQSDMMIKARANKFWSTRKKV